MTYHSGLHSWRIVGHSVRGAAHQRTQKPNQDALLVRKTFQTPELHLIVSVADGHGGAHYFRSETGSRLAVEYAVTAIEQLLTSDETNSPSLSVLNHLAIEQLPKLLHRQWQQSVGRHVADNPFKPEELALTNEAFRRQLAENPSLAYGTTLLATAITTSFILYLQLGDGDILVGSETGSITRPIAPDDRLIANETTSLASLNAWQNMQVVLQVLDKQLPAPVIILLTTDGYSNSFQNNTAFLKVIPDFLKSIRQSGLAPIKRNLPGWLRETSLQGSGDDITLALICRADILPSFSRTRSVSTKRQPSHTFKNKNAGVKPAPPWRRKSQHSVSSKRRKK